MDEIKGFEKILKEVLELKKKKAGDYGNCWRIFGVQGIYSEIGKKFSRLWLNKDKPKDKINFESIRDTAIDAIVYHAMLIQLLDENDIEDKILKLLSK